MKTVNRTFAVLFCAFLFTCLARPVTAGFADAADAFENFYMAGECHSSVGVVNLATYLSDFSTYNGSPQGPQIMPGPKLYHKKSRTNFANDWGTWCGGSDPIPYPIEPNSQVQWAVGEAVGGWFQPELHMYFGVGDPIDGKETPCILDFYQDATGNDVTVTMKKTDGCKDIPVMMNNLKIKQSGIYCADPMRYMGEMNGYSEGYTRIGDSSGNCPTSARLEKNVDGEEERTNKMVYITSFSVYWDPPINGTATAAGFDYTAALAPGAAPTSSPSASNPPVSGAMVANFMMAIVAAIMMAFFSD